MGGTKDGGKAASYTNKAKYGEDFYINIGALGGKAGKTGGFASEKVGVDGLTGKERASKVGAKGGTKSRRGTKSGLYYEDLEKKRGYNA